MMTHGLPNGWLMLGRATKPMVSPPCQEDGSKSEDAGFSWIFHSGKPIPNHHHGFWLLETIPECTGNAC